MEIMLKNREYQEGRANGKIVIRDTQKDRKNALVENHETLREVTHEFDSNTGSTLVNLETLKNINIELGRIADNVQNTDSSNLTDMGLMLYDIDHKILLLADLFHYTVKELEENIGNTRIINESYFDLIIGTNDQENILNGIPSN